LSCSEKPRVTGYETTWCTQDKLSNYGDIDQVFKHPLGATIGPIRIH